jgi:hypothetical protein
MDKKYFSGEGFTAETNPSAVKPSPRKPRTELLRPLLTLKYINMQKKCNGYSSLPQLHIIHF